MLQRGFSVLIFRLGELAEAEGDLSAARTSYEQSLEISERLAKADPSNIQAQRDWRASLGKLRASLGKLGDAARAEGDLAAARAAYEQSLEIFEALAQADPINVSVQHDWSATLGRLGDLAAASGDLGTARTAYEQGLQIAERLAKANPSNAGAQRAWMVLLNSFGDVARAEGDLSAAHAAYEKGLEIAEQRAQADFRNAQAQRDLWFSFFKIAQLLESQGSPQAIEWWRKAYEQISATKQRGIMPSQDEQAFELLREKSR